MRANHEFEYLNVRAASEIVLVYERHSFLENVQHKRMILSKDDNIEALSVESQSLLMQE